MIIELRAVLTAYFDKLADIIAPAVNLDQRAADNLARYESHFEVFEPLGEYPDLPNVRSGAVEHPPSAPAPGRTQWAADVLAAAALIDDHRLHATRCGCHQIFKSIDAHALHVAELVIDAIHK